MFTVRVVGSFDLKDGNINFKAVNIVNRQQPSHGAARDQSQEYGGEHPRSSGDDGRERLGQAANVMRSHRTRVVARSGTICDKLAVPIWTTVHNDAQLFHAKFTQGNDREISALYRASKCLITCQLAASSLLQLHP